jgi:3-hydroxyisobutyrate dehydrogenase
LRESGDAAGARAGTVAHTEARGDARAGARTVGLVGMGAMGGAMVGPLVDAGFAVRGCDIDAAAVARCEARGGAAAASPADAARDAAVLVLMVHDSAQVERVLFGERGAVAAMHPGAAVWLASTVTPAFARGLAVQLEGHGLHVVDGPVSGGVTGAESGELTVIAGGSAAALAACAAVMEACATRVFRVGDAGAGSTVKMINQGLVAAHIALTAEAIVLGAGAGVDLRQLVDVIVHSAGNSRMFEKRAPRIVAGDHARHSTIATFLKDLQIVLDTARGLDCRMPLVAAAQHVFDAAALAGHGADSDTMIVRAYEAWAGLRVPDAAGAPDARHATVVGPAR